MIIGSNSGKYYDIWITGKNDRQTSAIKTEVLLTYQDLYLQ
jgi:hypothetical protein